MNKLSIIVPVYNGEKSIAKLCRQINNALTEAQVNFEVILVDDNSSDNSFKEMLKLKKKHSWLKIIKLKSNYGQQNALLCGIRHATGNYFVTVDDDLQYNPKDIIPLYNKIQEGYDAVFGIPAKKKHSKYRNLGTKLTDFLFNYLLKKPKDIRISSFRIMNRKVADAIVKYPYSFIYISAVILKNTLNVANITVDHRQREYGKSNYNFLKLMKLYFMIIIYHSSLRGLKFLRKDKEQYIIEEKML